MNYFQNNNGFNYNSTNTTYITKFKICNKNNSIPLVELEPLKATIVAALRRWNLLTREDSGIWEQHREISSLFIGGYIDTYKLFTSWVIMEITVGKQDSNIYADYTVTMYATGRYRRNGSSVDYFEQVMDCLYIQIKNPDKIFSDLRECYEYNLDEELGAVDFITDNTDYINNETENNEEYV